MKILNMDIMEKLCLIFLLTLLPFNHVEAQGSDKAAKYLEKADLYFYEKNYEDALKFYQKAFKKDNKNSYSSEKIAYSNLYLNNINEALKWFQKTEKIYGNFIPDFAVRYAMALMEAGNYELAREKFQEYNDFFESNNPLVYKYLLSIENKDKYYDDSIYYSLMNTILSSKQANFSPQYYNNQLFYINSATDGVGEAPTYRKTEILAAKVQADTSIRPIGVIRGDKQFTNKILSLSIAENVDEIYGTYITRSENPYKTYGLLKGNLLNKSEIGPLKDVEIDGFDLNILHVTVDDKAEVIIFSSDAPGGFGGFDLYMAKKENGVFKNVTNLGPYINTSEDEIFPYLYNDSTLYFSSKGHGGLGGFDLFSVLLHADIIEPINMGYPINTNSDDFTMSFYSDFSGFLSSNRPNGKGLEDIYQFTISSLKYRGVITDENTGENLKQVDVNVSFTDGKKEQLSLADNGTLVFNIAPGDEFDILVSKKGYEDRTFHVDSKEWVITGTSYNAGPLPMKAEETVGEPIAMKDIMDDETVTSEKSNKNEYVEVIQEGDVEQQSEQEDKVEHDIKALVETGTEKQTEKIVENTDAETVRQKEEVTENEIVNESTKKEIEKTVNKTLQENTEEVEKTDTDYHFENKNHGINFLVQIGASKKPVNQAVLKRKYIGNLPINSFKYGSWNLYFIGQFSSYYKAKKLAKECGVHDAFVSAYNASGRLQLMEAIKLAHVPQEDNSKYLASKKDNQLLKEVIYFRFDEVALTDEDMSKIYRFVDSLKVNPDYYLELVGYSDKQGSIIYNKAISYQRAVNIQQIFIVEGIATKRLEVYGLGEGNLSLEPGKQRRVEIIMKKR